MSEYTNPSIESLYDTLMDDICEEPKRARSYIKTSLWSSYSLGQEVYRRETHRVMQEVGTLLKHLDSIEDDSELADKCREVIYEFKEAGML